LILVAGIGNLLRADDGFGCQVVARLRREGLEGVEARDFGTRGHDLAFALCQDWERVILVDTVGLPGAPGSLHLIEPQAAPAEARGAHGMTPEHVLNLVEQLGGKLPPVVLLGCVPADLGQPEELDNQLSAPVSEAVERALEILRDMVQKRA
jgi:hydrogenase maturation protease